LQALLGAHHILHVSRIRVNKNALECGATVDLTISVSLKCDGTRAETRFRLSAKRTSLFKPAGASV
jgi:hypothetical protein